MRLAEEKRDESSRLQRTRATSVQEVKDARIERPTDVLVRITSTNICGSDLHMFEGRTDFPRGGVFGHATLALRDSCESLRASAPEASTNCDL